jgi:hypothetical protein
MRKIRTQKISAIRGQTVVETFFVFTMIIFLTFTIVNLAILLHTKNIATYAAFMAGRSYQVLGSQENADSFLEVTKNGPNQKFLATEKTLGAIRVAEDIFTCALPWMAVPEGEIDQKPTEFELEKNPGLRCGEGIRKYKKLNVGSGKEDQKSLDFLPFKSDALTAFGKPKLPEVKGGFAEAGREPLRYGILQMRYQTPLLYNFMNVFGAAGTKARDKVFVPILLNPGLATGLQDKKPGDEDEEDKK